MMPLEDTIVQFPDLAADLLQDHLLSPPSALAEALSQVESVRSTLEDIELDGLFMEDGDGRDNTRELKRQEKSVEAVSSATDEQEQILLSMAKSAFENALTIAQTFQLSGDSIPSSWFEMLDDDIPAPNARISLRQRPDTLVNGLFKPYLKWGQQLGDQASSLDKIFNHRRRIRSCLNFFSHQSLVSDSYIEWDTLLQWMRSLPEDRIKGLGGRSNTAEGCFQEIVLKRGILELQTLPKSVKEALDQCSALPTELLVLIPKMLDEASLIDQKDPSKEALNFIIGFWINLPTFQNRFSQNETLMFQAIDTVFASALHMQKDKIDLLKNQFHSAMEQHLFNKDLAKSSITGSSLRPRF